MHHILRTGGDSCPFRPSAARPYREAMSLHVVPGIRRNVRHGAVGLALLATLQLSGCALIAQQAGTTVHGQTLTYEEVEEPIELKEGEKVSIELDETHPSVGSAYVIVAEPDTRVLRAEVEHVKTNPANMKPGGDAGVSYLRLTAMGAGTEKVRVVYCFRAEPDENGNCDQAGATAEERLLDKEFTVRVE